MQTTGNPIMAIFFMLLTLAGSLGAPAGQAPAAQGRYRAYAYVDGEPRWGYIDQSGAFAIPPQFQQAEAFGSEALAVAEQNGKYGLINRAGDWVVQPVYEWISGPSADGVRMAYRSDTRTAIDRQGKLLFSSPELVGDFSDGPATIVRGKGKDARYGYVNTAGKVVIAPQFIEAQPFQNGKALVKVKAGEYAVVTPTGERLGTLHVDVASNLGEDLVAFRDKASGLWGYMSVTGDVVIPARFQWAQAFSGGEAIVEANGKGPGNRLGLIDREGNYVIPPQYSSLVPLGSGFYAVGEPTETYRPGPYHKKAIFTADGKQLTDFRFDEVGKYAHTVFAVTDDTGAYFVDDSGARVTSLPKVAGFGTLEWVDGLIRSQQDKDLAYLTPDGKVVWQSDRSFTLPSGMKVESVKYRPNRYLLVYYPQFSGLPDPQINGQVKSFFLGSLPAAPDPTHDMTVDFTVRQLQNLLAIERSGYDYPIGAAHGMPSRDYLHVDATTGQTFTLADLFGADADYTARLTDLVNQQIAARPQDFFPGAKAKVTPNTIFTVKDDALVLSFPPYEIAPYAAGFPTFAIPFTVLQDLLDTEGAFWKAMH